MSHIGSSNRFAETGTDRILAEPAPAPRIAPKVMLKALLGLIVVDAGLRLGGYRWLRSRLMTCRVRLLSKPGAGDRQAGALAALDRVAVWYPWEAMCLQRSAVALWLLRDLGVPAQMVIGCRHTPFHAHAWVEVDGCVVTDDQGMKQRYQELERI